MVVGDQQLHDEGSDQGATLDEEPRRVTEKRHPEDELEVEDTEMQEENDDRGVVLVALTCESCGPPCAGGASTRLCAATVAP